MQHPLLRNGPNDCLGVLRFGKLGSVVACPPQPWQFCRYALIASAAPSHVPFVSQQSFGHGVWMRGLRFAELQKEVLAQFTEIKLPDLPKRKLIDSSSDTEACRVSCGTGLTDAALTWLLQRRRVQLEIFMEHIISHPILSHSVLVNDFVSHNKVWQPVAL
jgi:hypothetical protein